MDRFKIGDAENIRSLADWARGAGPLFRTHVAQDLERIADAIDRALQADYSDLEKVAESWRVTA